MGALAFPGVRERLFDERAFAQRLQAAIASFPSMRQAAAAADISHVTMSRAANGWPDLSHENYLRLASWLGQFERASARQMSPTTGDLG
jgi:hypothetical protein